MVKIEKLKNIEFLRFLFVLSVASWHIRDTMISIVRDVPSYKTLISCFSQTNRAVDYFFIIAGFFLFVRTDFNQKFIDFVKKKLIRFMPVVVFSLLLYWIVSLFTPLKFNIYGAVFALLTLNNIGITIEYAPNTPVWFISALFWAMCLYFYLYKITDKKWFNLICACMVFFCYSMYLHTDGENNINICYIFNRGMLRALAGIGAGYFLSVIYMDNIEKIKNWSLDIWKKLCFTLMEGGLLFWLVYNTFFYEMVYKNFLILFLGFMGLFLLFVIKQGWISKLLDNNFSAFIGQFTFSIFLTHMMIKNLWGIYICKEHLNWVAANPVLNLILIYSVIILFGILTYYLYERPITKYLKNKFCSTN